MTSPPNDARSTAVIAGVLALVGSAYWAFETWAGLVSVSHRSDPSRIVPGDNGNVDFYPSGVWIGWIVLAEVMLATGALAFGAVLLLLRKSVGRWLILIGCGVSLAALVHPLFASSYYYRSFTALSFFYAVLAAVTAVLVLAPSTRRWCHRRTS